MYRIESGTAERHMKQGLISASYYTALIQAPLYDFLCLARLG